MDHYKDNPADMNSFKDIEVQEKHAGSPTQKRHKKAKVLGISILALLVFGAVSGAVYHLPPGPQASSKHEGAQKRDTDGTESRLERRFDPWGLIEVAGAAGAYIIVGSSWLMELLHSKQNQDAQKQADQAAKEKQAHQDEWLDKILSQDSKKNHPGHHPHSG